MAVGGRIRLYVPGGDVRAVHAIQSLHNRRDDDAIRVWPTVDRRLATMERPTGTH